MLKVEQSAIIHNANVNLVINNRGLEINYFSSLFSSFATQAGKTCNTHNLLPT